MDDKKASHESFPLNFLVLRNTFFHTNDVLSTGNIITINILQKNMNISTSSTKIIKFWNQDHDKNT